MSKPLVQRKAILGRRFLSLN